MKFAETSIGGVVTFINNYFYFDVKDNNTLTIEKITCSAYFIRFHIVDADTNNTIATFGVSNNPQSCDISSYDNIEIYATVGTHNGAGTSISAYNVTFS